MMIPGRYTSPLVIALVLGGRQIQALVAPCLQRVLHRNTRLFRLGSVRQPYDDNDGSAFISDALEQRVYASAQSNVDFQRVLDALDRTELPPDAGSDADLLLDDERGRVPVLEPWKIGVAAASAAAVMSYLFFHSFYLSVFLMGFLFVAATLDDDSLSGAVARILGRTTIRSVQASEPKLKALARAVVTGEAEVQELRKRNAMLEEEVRHLRIWKDRRLKIEAAMPYYSVEELKRCARANGLAVSGTKNELMMRLVVARALSLDNFSS